MQNCRRRCMVSRLRRLSGLPHPAWMGVPCWVATLLAALMTVTLCTRLLVKPSCCSRTAAPCAPFSSRNTRAFYAVELLSSGWPAHSLHVCHTTCDTVPVDPLLPCPTGHPVLPGCGTKTAASLPCVQEGPPLPIFMIVKCKGGRGVGETPTTGPLLIAIEAWTGLTHSTLNIFIYIYFK